LSHTPWQRSDQRLKRIYAVLSRTLAGRSDQQIQGFGEYRVFYLVPWLAIPASKYGALANIGRFISHPLAPEKNGH
jgi:hypothetical protein